MTTKNEDFPDKTTKLRNFCYKTDLGVWNGRATWCTTVHIRQTKKGPAVNDGATPRARHWRPTRERTIVPHLAPRADPTIQQDLGTEWQKDQACKQTSERNGRANWRTAVRVRRPVNDLWRHAVWWTTTNNCLKYTVVRSENDRATSKKHKNRTETFCS